MSGAEAAATPPLAAAVPRGWWRGAAVIVLLAGALLVYWSPLAAYARDNYYQSHFLFLWLFFAAALYRAGRGQLSWRAPLGDTRGVSAVGALALAAALLHVGLSSGSTTAQRLSLVVFFASVVLLAMRHWSLVRCLAHAAFALLCFGIPYSAYAVLTHAFRGSFMGLLAALPRYTWLDYEVQGQTLLFPGPPAVELAITPDCSGFNQLVTFLGLAFLGALTGRPTLWRIVGLFALGAVLAYAANLARVLTFVVLVDAGYPEFVVDPTLHGAFGLLSYLPFVVAFVWVALRTHRPLLLPAHPPSRRGVPILLALLPLLGVRALHGDESPATGPAPTYVTALSKPPGYVALPRDDVARLEADERGAYDTPWLVHRLYAHERRPDLWLEVFGYLTRSRSHLSVHQIASCLQVNAESVRYGPPVTVGGRTFWSFELESEAPRNGEAGAGDAERRHGYFSFWVGGDDLDDSLATQLGVFWSRITGGVRDVGLTRFIMPGPLPAEPSAEDLAILTWRARQLAGIGR